MLQGDLAAGHAALQALLPLFERYEPPWAVAWLETRLARAALELGEQNQAAQHYARCLLLCQRNDFRWGFAECLEGLAALAEDSRAGAARAASLLGAAETIRDALGQTRAVHEQDLYSLTLARISAQLAPPELESARQHGAGLSLQAALALAAEG